MNITIEIKDTKYTVDDAVAQHIFCLKMQIASLNKAVEVYAKVEAKAAAERIVADDGGSVVVQRPFRGKR